METKVTIIDEKAIVYSTTSVTSPIISELYTGAEIIIERPIKDAGTTWIAVKLSDGKFGYILGDVKICHIRTVALAQSSVDILESPFEGSRVKMTYKNGDKFTLAGIVKQGETQWVEIRSDSGEVGFMPGGTKINEVAGAQKGMFRREDYWPYMFGIFVFAGLVAVPAIWGLFIDLPYDRLVAGSIAACAVFAYAHTRNGNFAFGRFLVGLLFMFLMSMRITARSGGMGAFVPGGVLGYLVMSGCGWLGVGLARALGISETQKDSQSEPYLNLQDEELEIDEVNLYDLLTLIKKQKQLFGKNYSEEIQERLGKLVHNKEEGILLLNSYSSLFKIELVKELTDLSSSYEAIKENVSLFIELDIVVDTFPHQRADPNSIKAVEVPKGNPEKSQANRAKMMNNLKQLKNMRKKGFILEEDYTESKNQDLKSLQNEELQAGLLELHELMQQEKGKENKPFEPYTFLTPALSNEMGTKEHKKKEKKSKEEIRTEINNLLTNLIASKEDGITVLDGYQTLFNQDLIKELSSRHNSYERIKERVAIFIDLDVVYSNYPHERK